MPAKNPNHGGARSGAGRKTSDNVKIVERVKTTVSLDRLTSDVLLEFSDNFSESVRMLASAYIELRNGRANRSAPSTHRVEAAPVQRARAAAIPIRK